MKSWIVAGSALALMAATGVAVAQSPAPPPPPPQAQDGAPMPPDGMHGPRGPMGWHRGPMAEMMRMHGPMESRAAHFRFRKDGALVDIKCADAEPMKACVDAATALMDKLPAAPK